jgi:hypothetical protein
MLLLHSTSSAHDHIDCSLDVPIAGLQHTLRKFNVGILPEGI